MAKLFDFIGLLEKWNASNTATIVLSGK